MTECCFCLAGSRNFSPRRVCKYGSSSRSMKLASVASETRSLTTSGPACRHGGSSNHSRRNRSSADRLRTNTKHPRAALRLSRAIAHFTSRTLSKIVLVPLAIKSITARDRCRRWSVAIALRATTIAASCRCRLSLAGNCRPRIHLNPKVVNPTGARQVKLQLPRPANGYTDTFSSFSQGHPPFQIHQQNVRESDVLRFNHHFISADAGFRRFPGKGNWIAIIATSRSRTVATCST